MLVDNRKTNGTDNGECNGVFSGNHWQLCFVGAVVCGVMWMFVGNVNKIKRRTKAEKLGFKGKSRGEQNKFSFFCSTNKREKTF